MKNMPPIPDPDEAVKRALKEGIKEWLDEQFATFGKWTLVGLPSVRFALPDGYSARATLLLPPSKQGSAGMHFSVERQF